MKPIIGTPTDYTKKEHWLAFPEDPSKSVDLIYLYPSSCTNEEAGVICDVDDESMIFHARRNFSNQATVFEPLANIYAPFWRQVNGAKLTCLSFEEIDEAEWSEPRTDVYAMLDYYFENLNQGRPYFLAGHSQGSRLLYMVLSEYMKEYPDRYANMIAAYTLGDALTKDFLAANPHVKAAQGANDTGVVVSWNTEGPANKWAKTLIAAPGAISINPLNWRTDETPAYSELNLGSYMPRVVLPGMRKLPVNADAVIDLERGTVVVTRPELRECVVTKTFPDFKGYEPVFGPESYHMCDYSFFYLNLRENALDRAERWYMARNGLLEDES